MDISKVVELLQVVATNLPGAINTASQLVEIGKEFYAVANGKQPSPDEVARLEASIDADVLEALSPLPPAQPGDPDA